MALGWEGVSLRVDGREEGRARSAVQASCFSSYVGVMFHENDGNSP